MIKHITDCATLANGIKMPWLGLGVYKIEDAEVDRVIKAAVQAGYRSIDTAAFYHNEVGVGKAIKTCGVPREELFITTKVWNDRQGYETTLKAFEESRQKLGLEIIDLYLIHWPVKGKFKDTWRALEKLYREGFVKAIGVSNFHVYHLEELLADCRIKPMVNQVEYHPQLAQKELHAFCKAQGIQLEAWAPLIRGRLFDNATLMQVAEKHGKTPAQIILRWDLQTEVVTIPKSVSEPRILENAAIFDFELSPEDMSLLDTLNQNKRIGADPDNFDF